MNIEEKNMKDFLSAAKMGKCIFDIYYQKTANKQLKELINNSLEILKTHEDKLKNEIFNSGYNPYIELKLSQKCAINMEKVIIKNKNDFYLCLEILSSLHMAINKSLKFLFKNHNKIPFSYHKTIREIIREYDEMIVHYKNYSMNLIN